MIHAEAPPRPDEAPSGDSHAVYESFEDAAAVRDADGGLESQLLQAGDIVYLSATHLPQLSGAVSHAENYLHAHGFCGTDVIM